MITRTRLNVTLYVHCLYYVHKQRQKTFIQQSRLCEHVIGTSLASSSPTPLAFEFVHFSNTRNKIPANVLATRQTIHSVTAK